jgi:dTDP-4-amino-4,6-dideoxygalactose transaminase
MYRALLSDVPQLSIPLEADYAKHIYHVYAVRHKSRDALMNKLKENDIHCGIHYPVPIHKQKSYSSLGINNGSSKVSEVCANEFISLPMFAELKREQLVYVADRIKSALATIS